MMAGRSPVIRRAHRLRERFRDEADWLQDRLQVYSPRELIERLASCPPVDVYEVGDEVGVQMRIPVFFM